LEQKSLVCLEMSAATPKLSIGDMKIGSCYVFTTPEGNRFGKLMQVHEGKLHIMNPVQHKIYDITVEEILREIDCPPSFSNIDFQMSVNVKKRNGRKTRKNRTRRNASRKARKAIKTRRA
jgi:hypothetical protein